MPGSAMASSEGEDEMMADIPDSKVVPSGSTRRQAITGVVLAFGGLALGSAKSWAAAGNDISHTAESIHQEPEFKASRKRVYEALTDAKQFDKIVELSGAMQSMHLGDKPAEISRELGGAFALFGGYLTGDKSNLCRTSASSKPGEQVVGILASTRSRGLN